MKEKVLSAKEKKEIKKLERQALGLWGQVVRRRAGKKCEVSGCKKVKFLNVHHIESYITNKTLRYDPENGLCLCAGDHKFKWLSAHKSFCFLYKLLLEKRKVSFDYLLKNYQIKIPMTKEFLEGVIRGLSRELRVRGK